MILWYFVFFAVRIVITVVDFAIVGNRLVALEGSRQAEVSIC